MCSHPFPRLDRRPLQAAAIDVCSPILTSEIFNPSVLFIFASTSSGSAPKSDTEQLDSTVRTLRIPGITVEIAGCDKQYAKQSPAASPRHPPDLSATRSHAPLLASSDRGPESTSRETRPSRTPYPPRSSRQRALIERHAASTPTRCNSASATNSHSAIDRNVVHHLHRIAQPGANQVEPRVRIAGIQRHADRLALPDCFKSSNARFHSSRSVHSAFHT